MFLLRSIQILPSITKILSSLILKYNFVSVDNIIQFVNNELVEKIVMNQNKIKFDDKINISNLVLILKTK